MNHRTITNTVTQVSILDALLVGQFDGRFPCADLLKYGDFGIGTFDQMDGEMVILDGSIFQVRSDGEVYSPDRDSRTPFATVCRFSPDQTWTSSDPMDLEEMKSAIDEQASNQNVFLAIRIDGNFSHLRTQVLRRQSRPYPPTADVVRACARFESESISGTIIGFRAPPYVRGVNDPGYHLHFLSKDRTRGGHVLAATMDRVTCAVSTCSNHLVILPDSGAGLSGMDLSEDLVAALEEELSGRK